MEGVEGSVRPCPPVRDNVVTPCFICQSILLLEFIQGCLSHLREGVSVLVLSCVSLLLLRIWLMGFKTPEFAASDNPAAHDPNILVRTLTYIYLPGEPTPQGVLCAN